MDDVAEEGTPVEPPQPSISAVPPAYHQGLGRVAGCEAPAGDRDEAMSEEVRRPIGESDSDDPVELLNACNVAEQVQLYAATHLAMEQYAAAARTFDDEAAQVDAFVKRGNRERNDVAATDVAAGAGDGMEGAAEVFGFFASLAPGLSGSDTADLWEWSKEALTTKEKRKLRDERALSRAPPQRA